MIIYVTFDHFRSRFGSNKHDFSLKSNGKVAIEEQTNVKGSLIRHLFPDKGFIVQVKFTESFMLDSNDFFYNFVPGNV